MYKDLTRLLRNVEARVAAMLRGLIEEPRPDGVKRLKGAESIYRLRVGSFRILYEVEDGALLVLVIRIGDRKGMRPPRSCDTGLIGARRSQDRRHSSRCWVLNIICQSGWGRALREIARMQMKSRRSFRLLMPAAAC